MANSRNRAVERAFLFEMGRRLEALSSVFSEKRLTHTQPGLAVLKVCEKDYCSEIRVYMLRDGQIDDALEFFVFRNGEQATGLDEALEWIEGEIRAL